MQPGDNTLPDLKAKLKNCGAGVVWLGYRNESRILQIIYRGTIVAEAGIVFRGYSGYKLHVITWEPHSHYKEYYLSCVEDGDKRIREVIQMYK